MILLDLTVSDVRLEPDTTGEYGTGVRLKPILPASMKLTSGWSRTPNEHMTMSGGLRSTV